MRSDHHRFRLTLSCGLVVTDAPARSLDAWMALADAGLYAAKAQGRNRVILQQQALPKDERLAAHLDAPVVEDLSNDARLSA